MKKYKDIGIYDFSDYAEEITGNALFEINGRAEVENSDKGVAGAKPGAGGGIGQSGSVSVSVGNFKSLEDAKGTYGCIGGSGGTSGFSIGGDAIISKNGIVGLAFSVGLGVGEKAEGHGRIGYTGIKSFKGESE